MTVVSVMALGCASSPGVGGLPGKRPGTVFSLGKKAGLCESLASAAFKLSYEKLLA